ncbi:MAG: L,D-transpeptidase [Clostridia bacterium]|nr:L,D-transpeptidase [Clostridia bacterium]
MKDDAKKVMSNKILWGTIILALVIVVTTEVAVVMIRQSRTETVKAEANLKDSSSSTNIIQDVNDIEDITNIEYASEEQLNKISEKVAEETKKQEKAKEEKKKNTQKTTTTTTETKKKYYIKVNYGAQVVNVYTYDKNGNYTVPVKAFVCSTGTATPTSGVYKIPYKINWCKMYGDVWAHYCSVIVGSPSILFHSVPSLQPNEHSLEYWAYDKLGTKASMGCVRLTTRDAKWIFDNVSIGTSVEFYSSSNPGPLGKPIAQKISNAPGDLKNWDPTDPVANNPWRNYHPEEHANTQTNGQNANVVNNAVSDSKNTTNTQQSNNATQNSQTTQNQQNNITQNTQITNSANNQSQNQQTANGQIQNSQTNHEITSGNQPTNNTTNGQTQNSQLNSANNEVNQQQQNDLQQNNLQQNSLTNNNTMTNTQH